LYPEVFPSDLTDKNKKLRTTSKILISIAIATITALLVLNFILTRRNNQVIEENRLVQRQAEQIKVTISQFAIRIIHNLDLGLRSYALFNDEKYLYPLNVAVMEKDSILSSVEYSLKNQGYPLAEFILLKDSINAYTALNMKLFELFQNNQMEEFMRLADQDKGYHLWLQFESFASKVYQFEDEVVAIAQARYTTASRNNSWIQIALFFISVPTLLITSFHAYKKFAYEVRARKAEEEKALLLVAQNESLEKAVAERTKEIQGINRILQQQHEEISAQNEEITAQNDELNRHREELASQNLALMESKKRQLQLYSNNIIEKTELIHRLNEEIQSLKTFSTNQPHVESFSKALNATILTDDDWEEFKKTFEEVYPNFFATLRLRFPEITASELRLSALIKMNLSLKEAANSLGISADSVKKSRYRLKKKIALPEEDSLEMFIRSL
jgi:CHASE3 domain sensor protein